MTAYDSERNQYASLLDHVLLVLLGKEMWAKHVLSEGVIVGSSEIDTGTKPEVFHVEYELRDVRGCFKEYHWKWSHSFDGVVKNGSGNTKQLLEYMDKHVPKEKMLHRG